MINVATRIAIDLINNDTFPDIQLDTNLILDIKFDDQQTSVINVIYVLQSSSNIKHH